MYFKHKTFALSMKITSTPKNNKPNNPCLQCTSCTVLSANMKSRNWIRHIIIEGLKPGGHRKPI